MKKPVKRFFKSFDSIFTLNYDNNIEKLTNKTIYHCMGIILSLQILKILKQFRDF